MSKSLWHNERELGLRAPVNTPLPGVSLEVFMQIGSVLYKLFIVCLLHGKLGLLIASGYLITFNNIY